VDAATKTNQKEIAGDSIDNDNNGYIDDVFGYNFVNKNNTMNILGDHGTAVAGIIGANRNNSIGMAGLAENVKLMSVIVCDDSGCAPDDIKNGIKYAVDNGAQIIELSLGSNSTSGYQAGYDEVMKYAYDSAMAIQMKRFAKVFDFELKDGIPEPLLQLSSGKLEELKSACAVNWLAFDGVWFQVSSRHEFVKALSHLRLELLEAVATKLVSNRPKHLNFRLLLLRNQRIDR